MKNPFHEGRATTESQESGSPNYKFIVHENVAKGESPDDPQTIVVTPDKKKDRKLLSKLESLIDIHEEPLMFWHPESRGVEETRKLAKSIQEKINDKKAQRIIIELADQQDAESQEILRLQGEVGPINLDLEEDIDASIIQIEAALTTLKTIKKLKDSIEKRKGFVLKYLRPKEKE